MNNLKNKKVIVLGLGKSGQAAAKKLVTLGANVFALDSQEKDCQELKTLGVKLELGEHRLSSLDSTDLIVVSPGIRLDIPILIEAKQRSIPIIAEIELAYQILTKPIIAVTGTNGKTTTTTLIGEMLKASGLRIALAGNIGSPLVSVDDSNLDYIVVEISSYQLETITTFKPWISVILNIQEDHLSRHGSMAEYMRQKARIFTNQTGDDYLVYNADDLEVVEMVKAAQAQGRPFKKNNAAIITLKPKEIKIPGRHNLENAIAAATVANLCSVTPEIVAQVLRTFVGVEHRLEFVAEVEGVKYYNDSKATNPQSTLVALETFRGQRINLVLGGRDKGVDLDALVTEIKNNVNSVILLGEAKDRFKKALDDVDYKNISVVDDMAQTVAVLQKNAKPGDVALLSPACASFDMFANFEERGRVFKQLVQQL